MIDFIKIALKLSSVDNFLKNFSHAIKGQFDGDTFELTGEYKARIRNIELKITQVGWLIISGSIHEFWNDGNHNHNDFSMQDFLLSIKELIEIIGMDLWNLRLYKIEIGVNIIPVIPVGDFIRNTFLHKGKDFRSEITKGEGLFFVCQHKEYKIKIYDKGKQNKLSYPLLRFELNYSSEILRKNRIFILKDILNFEKRDSLKSFLLKTFLEIIYFDSTIRTNDLSKRNKEKIVEWANPLYWQKLSNEPASKNTFANEVRRLQNITKISSDNIQTKTFDLINKKLGELDNISEDDIQVYFGMNVYYKQNEDGIEVGTNGNDFLILKERETGTNGSSIIVPFNTEVRRCKLTKLDISMQADDHDFLTIDGVEYYHQNFPKIYKRLEERLRPKWKDAPVSKRNLEIAHGIRNTFNKRNNALRNQLKNKKGHFSLFSDPTLLNPELTKFPEIIIKESGYLGIDILKKE